MKIAVFGAGAIGGYLAVSGHSKGPTTELAGGVHIPVLPGVSEQMGELAGAVHSAVDNRGSPLRS